MKRASYVHEQKLTSPVRFSPSVERPAGDEAKTTQGLIAIHGHINEKTLADGGHAIRSTHAKSHGRARGCGEITA